jgi:hypothetical protein
LSRLNIPVELYAPYGESLDQPMQLTFGELNEPAPEERARFIAPEWVTIIAILDRLERKPYHWPVGRIMFQKLVYFATVAGVPTGLSYEAASYGPYASNLGRMVARLQNNGLVVEQQHGNMFEVRVGSTYRDAVTRLRGEMEEWRPAVDKTVDLMSRMNTQTAEVAASVHFAATSLEQRYKRRLTTLEVINAVEDWKIRRKPPLTRDSIIHALVVLALRGWINVQFDDEFEPLIEEFVLA